MMKRRRAVLCIAGPRAVFFLRLNCLRIGLRRLKGAFLRLNGLELPFWQRVGRFAELLDGQSDARARLMHLALQNHHLTPRDYFSLTEPEQAFIAASDIVLQREREWAQKKASVTKRR